MSMNRVRTSANAQLRRKRNKRGHWSEHLAALWLQLKMYRVLVRRFRHASGEIDLIVRRGKRIAFVEVKQRQSFETAEAAVSASQRQRIRRAASAWLARIDLQDHDEVCFDLVLIVPWRWPRHIKNAL